MKIVKTQNIIRFIKHTNQAIISCFSFRVFLPDGYFMAYHPEPTGWTHVVLNYSGPNNGIQMYMDGVEVGSDTTKAGGPYSAGDGRIVAGRYYTNQDRNYASVQVDELLFFNQTLTAAEIEALPMV